MNEWKNILKISWTRERRRKGKKKVKGIESNGKDSLGLSSKIKGRLGGSAECCWSCYITTSDAAKYTASSQTVRNWGRISIFSEFHSVEFRSVGIIIHQPRGSCRTVGHSWSDLAAAAAAATTYHPEATGILVTLLRGPVVAELLPVTQTLTLIYFRHTSGHPKGLY